VTHNLDPSTTEARDALPRATARRRPRWATPAIAAGSLLLGIAIGGASSGADAPSSRPGANGTDTSELDDLRNQLDAAEERAKAAEGQLQDARAAAEDADAAAADLAEREAELAELDEELAAREAELDASEEARAARTFGIGTWTVGVDIEPGNYRLAHEVSETCYWGIYRSGTNKDDIVQNDIVTGGRPSVTLREGQDFDSGCGTWELQ